METLKYAESVTAKKDHKCDFCGEKIRMGDVYKKSTHKQDGYMYDWKSHQHCEDIATKLNMYDDECDEGLTQDSFQERINDVYFDLMYAIFKVDDVAKYSDVLQQTRYVQFGKKLFYVINHYTNQSK